jgi:hypothetical protein
VDVDKEVAIQVLDKKGSHAAFPKVVLKTPFVDVIYTASMGRQHQKILDSSPCSARHKAATAVALGAAAGDDVAYFFKPAQSCPAVLSLCGSHVDTEAVVLSDVDDVSVLFSPYIPLYHTVADLDNHR